MSEEETNLEYYFRYIIENLFYSGTIATFMICVTMLILYWQRG